MFDQFITSPQAAKILNIDRITVARLIREGKIPATKFADRWLIEKAAVEKFAETYVSRRGRPTGWSPKGNEERSQ
jgi:excisionase family DNA binding protein